MRTQTSHAHYPGTLRRVALSAVLVSAGWFAGVSGVAAQDAAGQDAQQVLASPGGSAPAVPAPQADIAGTTSAQATRVASETSGPSPAAADPAPAVAVDTSATQDDPVTVADSTASKKVFVTGTSVTRYDMASLDDRVLGNQHGRAVGMLMVAAVPDSMRGNSVTLWDEIGPPTQTPQPVDAARAAQSGNIVNYTRK